jgi:hypothetical protein
MVERSSGFYSPNTHHLAEMASEMMLDALVKENNIEIPQADLDFIKALIAGDKDRCPYALFSCYLNNL